MSRLLHTLSVVLLVAQLGAQVLQKQRPPQREEARPMEFTAGQDDNLFSLSRSQEDIHEWEKALEELAAGDHKGAVERLHKLLLAEIGGVVPVGPGRFLGLRLAVVTTLANLSPAAAGAYEALVGREAGNLAQQPLQALGSDQLELLAGRFPTSTIGMAARTRLGDLALEAGNGTAAAAHFRQALDATAIGSPAEQRIAARLECAKVLLLPRTARTAEAANTGTAAAREVLEALPAAADPTGYSGAGGGEDGRTPMTLPAGQPEPVWSEPIAAPGFGERDSGLFAMFPIGDLDGIYVNTGREVVAFDPLRKEIAWVSASPLRDAETNRYALSDYDQGINQDMVLAAACGGDLVVAALQVPERSANVDFHNNFRIISKIPQRRLFAFSRSTGKLVWSHFDELDGPKTRRYRGHDSCGPPLILGDTVYAPIHDRSGAIAFAIAAYDLHTGILKWRRLVCSSQQEVNMFGNARLEFASSPLAIADGILFGAANLGVVFAVEAATGRIRWITAHEVVRMPTAHLRRQEDRAIFFANNSPVVVDQVVCCTPLDSPSVLGLDVENGRVLWRVPNDAPVAGTANDVRWLAGALDDEFVLAGHGAVAIKARSGQILAQQAEVRQLVRPERLRERADNRPSGRPAITADHVWFGGQGRIHGFDRAGNSIAQDQQVRAVRYQPGNLLLVDGIVVSLRLGALDVLFDVEAILARVEAGIRNTPDDPAALLRLATMRTALLPPDANAAQLAAVTALFRKGLDACIQRGLPRTHPVRAALQRQLFDQAMGAAMAALARDEARALVLLTEARQAAPDQTAWIHVQTMVLELLADQPAKLRVELDRLEREAGAANLTAKNGTQQPVAAFVCWRRARLPDLAPATAVTLWQQLLEQFPDVTFEREAARDLAVAAIGALIDANGPAVYAALAARADAALAAAGDDPAALRDLSERFPNSAAARLASTRLLDRSVRNGDLAVACEVLTHELARGAPSPGVLRRVIVAALARGNRGLAAAMARELRAHGNLVSDWADDARATYATVLDALAPQLASAVTGPALQLPVNEVARIKPRSPRENLRLPPLVRGSGFDRLPDEPLYAVAGGELLAIDLQSAEAQKPVLFALPVQFLEHIVVCGPVLVVPDLERLYAVDYRTGQLRWELPGASGRLLDGLGVQAGVLHVSAQSNDADNGAQFLGIEPLSGKILFTRTLAGERMKPVPKPVDGQLLVMQTDAQGDAELLRLDPVTGKTITTVRIAASLLHTEAELRADGLATRIYPQGLCADAERIYLPIDSTLSGDAPRLLAVDNGGALAWKWQGQRQGRLLMAALRGDRVVVVEGSEERPGRIALLSARTGEVLRQTTLGFDIDKLNWQQTWLPNPAPPAVLLSFLTTAGGRERKLLCFGVDDGMPSFVEALGADDGEIERHPQFGPDFLTFGVRPAQRGPFRVYALRLGDRSGALPDGARYARKQLSSTFGFTTVGPYTVISSAECLLVLGTDESHR